MLSCGLNEVVTYSFVPEEINSLFVSGEQIKLKNPVSADLACMRSTTLLGLLLSAQNELKRQFKQVRLFEQGLSFSRDSAGRIEQNNELSVLLVGRDNSLSWANEDKEVDFYSIKALAEKLAMDFKLDFQYVRSSIKGFHPAKCASIVCDGAVVGCIGIIHPSVCEKLSLPVKSTLR